VRAASRITMNLIETYGLSIGGAVASNRSNLQDNAIILILLYFSENLVNEVTILARIESFYNHEIRGNVLSSRLLYEI